MTKRDATRPPGIVLAIDFLAPRGLTQRALADLMGVHVQQVNAIVRGRAAVTPRMALRLAEALETTPEFWMHLQVAVDLRAERERAGRTPDRSSARG